MIRSVNKKKKDVNRKDSKKENSLMKNRLILKVKRIISKKTIKIVLFIEFLKEIIFFSICFLVS